VYALSKKFILIALAGLGLMVFFLVKAQSTAAASPANLTLGKNVIAEGDDFNTRVIGIPWWNMNGSPYPDYFAAVQNTDRNLFNVTADGFWDMKSTTLDPSIWLLWSSIAETQRVLRQGDTRPIDANKYKLLSYYMCMDEAPGPTDFDWAANIFWMYDRAPHDDPNNGRTEFILFKQQGLFQNDGDCELITYDLSKPASWATGTWNNSPNKPQGLRLDPINQAGLRYQIGWVRLTTKDLSNVVQLSWAGAPAGENAFYLSLSGCGQDGILVGKQNGTNGTFNWGGQIQPGFSNSHPLPLPESFEPGTYYAYMKDSSGAVACAANNPFKVSAAPILDFQKPSFQSGPDFATVELNNPWGLAQPSDIADMFSITSAMFNDGILKITVQGPDPQLSLNLRAERIDTSKYFYLSYRSKMNSMHLPGAGWVQRWIWWYDGGPNVDHVTAQDMLVYENWHVYTIDLRTAPTENCGGNCWSGMPSVLRHDPLENFFPTSIDLDYFLLTGNESINKGGQFPIYFTTTAPNNATVKFYYDTDTNPANGRTLIGTKTLGLTELPTLSTTGNWSIFLPSVSTADPLDIDLYSASEVFVWNTSNVPRNTFYISADVDDGISVTTWYSEIPITIK